MRIGTAAITTIGMGEKECRAIAHLIHKVLGASKPALTPSGKPSKANVDVDEKVKKEVIAEVDKLLHEFVLYPNLDLDFMKKIYCK